MVRTGGVGERRHVTTEKPSSVHAVQMVRTGGVGQRSHMAAEKPSFVALCPYGPDR